MKIAFDIKLIEVNNFFIPLIILFFFTSLQAQESVNASGGNATGSGGTVSYSIGQVVYTTHTATSGSVAQGVQHPYEILVVDVENEEVNLSLEVFPNPTTNKLYLKTFEFREGDLWYYLFDVNGKLITSNPITTNQSEISMNNLSLGTYLLHISNSTKKLKTYKVIKSN